MSQPQPEAHQQAIFTIQPDGNVVLGAGIAPDEAAQAFWTAVTKHNPKILCEALQPFADYAKGRAADMIPSGTIISAGSLFARRQLTIDDCRAAAAALAPYK